MNLLVCGFSGAGKTTLVQSLGMKTFDLDQELAKEQGVTIAAMVEHYGWEEFRRMEFELLMRLILANVEENVVISLGGGTLSLEKLKILRQCLWVKLLWLDIPFNECWDRIKSDQGRPLTHLGRPEMEKLYHERVIFYQMADFVTSSRKEAENLIVKLVK